MASTSSWNWESNRGPGRECDRFNAGSAHDHVETGGELAVAVADQIAAPGNQVATIGGKITGGLPHPVIGGIAGDVGDIDLSAADVHEEEAVVGDQCKNRPDFGGEEVGGQQTIGMAADEVRPAGFTFSQRSGIDAMFFKDVFNSLVTEDMIQGSQGTGDSAITPARILPSHAKDQIDNGGISPRSPGGFGFPASGGVELRRDQFPMPPQYGFRRDDAGNGFERVPAQLFSDSCQRDSLAIGELRSAGNLVPQDAILGGQIFDLEPKLFVDLS